MNERIRVGDRVRVGTRTGTVSAVVEYPNRYSADPRGRYRVRLDNTSSPIYTRDALKIEEPKPTETEVLVDLKRLQAAHAAHEILGKDALLEDLIGVAEFVLGEHKKPVSTLADGVPVPSEGSVNESTDDLVITDRDGDKATFGHYGYGTTLAKVCVRSASDDAQRAVYLTEADVDAVIARLQAFKAKGFLPEF